MMDYTNSTLPLPPAILPLPLPYNPPWPPDSGPITDKRDFFNRIAELEDINRILKTAIHTSKAIVLRGERCTGKTSLINRTRQLLTEEIWPEQQLYLSLNIAPGNITSCADFAGELWTGLHDRLKQHRGQITADLEVPLKFDTVNGFVTQLEACQATCSGVTFVVFIDEFDYIIHQCSDLEVQKIIGLIRYLIEVTNLSLVFFIATLRDLPTGPGSPFPHAKLVLHPFNQANTNRLLTGLLTNRLTLPDTLLTWLYRFTNGQPYFIKLILTHLDLNSIAAKGLLTTVQVAARQAVTGDYAGEVLGDIYRNYLNNDERYIWLWLTTHQAELAIEDVQTAAASVKSAFRRLERRDFVALTPAGGYRLHPYLQEWLTGWGEFESELERLQVSGLKNSPADVQLNTPAFNNNRPQGLCIDRARGQVFLNGSEIPNLSPGGLEFRALVYLAERVGQVVSKDSLAAYVWQQEHYQEDDQRISAVIYRLRKVYGINSLETLRKAGYRLQKATLVQVL